MLASNPLGAAIAPLFVVAIMTFWGWRTAFYVMFVPGLIMALLFFVFVTDNPGLDSRVPAQELAEIGEGEATPTDSANGTTRSEPKIGFRDVLAIPNAFKFFLALFFFDMALGGFRTWLPTYLVKERGFSLLEMGAAASLPAFAGVVGSIVGGQVSDRIFSSSRRTPIVAAMLASAIFLGVMFNASTVTMLLVSQTFAGLFLSISLGAFWALPMTTIPKNVMGVAGGFINMAGQIATFLSPVAIGFLVGMAGGGFKFAFAFLIASVLVSCIVVLSTGRSVQKSSPTP
jgi:sugar phosphate permease